MRTEKLIASIFLSIVLILGIVAYSNQPVEEEGTLTTFAGLVNSTIISPQTPDDIIPIERPVKPFLYTEVSFMSELEGKAKKNKFIDIMLPAILVARHRLGSISEQVNQISSQSEWSSADSLFIQQLYERYKTDDLGDLKVRLKTHPNSIILAQAAIETGWGTSRFFREGNNVFGIWSFNPNEPRIPASVSREEFRAYLRKYDNISASIEGYFETVGKSNAYRAFRKARMRTSKVDSLTKHLINYSEMREAYVKQLNSMIRINKFKQYDSYQLDPAYIN